jgi:phospholipid transport system substrate-binding protein
MKKLFLLLFLAAFLSQPAMADDLQEVDQLVHKTVNAVMTIIQDTNLNEEMKKERVMDVVTPVFNLPLMAKLTLGRKHWPKLKREEREVFTDLFIKQLQRTYLSKAELAANEKITFEEPIRKKNKIYMITRVISRDDPIKLLYKLYKGKGKWRVYDVEIQDVSIVKSYGMQYSQILQEGNVDDLIRKMREKIEQNEKATAKQKGDK